MQDELHRIQSALTQADREIAREQLKQKIRSLGGIVGESSPALDLDLELTFLQRVLAWETGALSTHRDWLAQRGLCFEPPEDLREGRLQEELSRLIDALALARVFLYHTDHLSDAELYTRLWHEVLPDEAPDLARTADDGCHWDFADWSADDGRVWLAYYASPAERQEWACESPGVKLPPRKRPRFNRDHRLPRRE
jgi:hypothetical protein